MSTSVHAHAGLVCVSCVRRPASSPPLHPGVWRSRVVARLVVEFTVRARRRIKVHVVPRGLQSQVHGAVGGRRRAFMSLVVVVRLLKVGSWGSLEGRIGLWGVALSGDLTKTKSEILFWRSDVTWYSFTSSSHRIFYTCLCAVRNRSKTVFFSKGSVITHLKMGQYQ